MTLDPQMQQSPGRGPSASDSPAPRLPAEISRSGEARHRGISLRTFLVLLGVALLVGGVVALFASSRPDVLETFLAEHAIEGAPGVGPLPDYEVPALGSGVASRAAAGLIGTLLTCAVLLVVVRCLRSRREPRKIP